MLMLFLRFIGFALIIMFTAWIVPGISVENFKWAFEKGCSWSNMGGVEGTLDDGLTKFKDNFNPTINEFIGEFDIPIYPFMYRLTQKAYKILKSKHM